MGMRGRPTHSAHATSRMDWIHSPRFHVILYSLLLVITPFLMVRDFLQPAIAKLSTSVVRLGTLAVPVVPTVALVLLVTLLVVLRSRLAWRHVFAGVLGLGMIALAQQVADYYFDHLFYELQQNWHYIAYGIFAFMIHRDLGPRGVPLPRIMLLTFFFAATYSAVDEAFQMHMGSRVFDMGDIAKDVWGAAAGMGMLYVGSRRSRNLWTDVRELRKRELGAYLKSPASVFLLLFILGFLFLCFASVLTDPPYWKHILLFTVASFVVVFGLLHYSQFRAGKIVLLALVGICLVTQSFFFLKHRTEHVVYNRYGLTVYKGIPIPFFDVLFFPDGTFRLVDKKHYFNDRDRTFLLRQEPDILLIGSGSQGLGGKGFAGELPTHFVFNRFSQRGTQVIILPTPEACGLFNRLKQERKNVLFVLHNTC
jgi:VanZ family protein